MPNVYIETYGCAAAQAESEIMAGILQSKGVEVVNHIEMSDIIILYTCVVKSVTEQKILSRIEQLQKIYPDKKLIISGCGPETILNKLEAVAPEASFVSTHRIDKIDQAVRKVMRGDKIELLGDEDLVKLGFPRKRTNPVVAIVPISTGCMGACTYCQVRLVKGKLFSYPKPRIIKEIELSLKGGCKEIWLTSQDCSAYGKDKEKESQLPTLLENIKKISGNFNVRVGMSNPNHILPVLPDFIKAYNGKKIYKFLHIPIQSGDDKILKQMNRFYGVRDFEEIVDSFRESYRMNIWTDIIVGYPGETDTQFKNTLRLLKKVKPDYSNISRFAKREGTEAAKLQQLPTDEMKRRTAMATNLIQNIALEKNKEWIGWTGEILITERGKKPGQWIGRNLSYKSVVINRRGNLLGDRIKVKIIDAIPTTLVGWPLRD